MEKNIADYKVMKEYRVMITRNGYTTVRAESAEEALSQVKDLSKEDFDWEKVDDDVLDAAEIVDETPIKD